MINQGLKATSHLQNVQTFHTCCKLLKQQPSNLKNKKHSSQLWLTRYIQDPYVEKAKIMNYRCRSAFKLLEIQEQHKILSPGHVVVDCGAAPGSWTQVATKCTNADGAIQDQPKGKVVAIDRLPFHPIEGAHILRNIDFTLPQAQEQIRTILKDDKVDVLMSDMAPNATGVRNMDHENIFALVYSALKFSMGLMQTGGTFLAKVWDSEKTKQLESDLSKFYKTVKLVRPQATRSESSELFILAREFKGVKTKHEQ